MNDPFQPIIDPLSRATRVLVTTHVRPDGDALGTAAAAVLGLREKGIDAEVLLLSRLPVKYAFIFEDNKIVHHQLGEMEVASDQLPVAGEVNSPITGSHLPNTDHRSPTISFSPFDTVLVVDTGTWSQLPGLEQAIADWNGVKLVVDHHLTQQNWATAKLVVTHASAAGEIMADLLARWGVKLTPAIAEALFLAIASDTGWFQFANTTPKTMRLAADLIDVGVHTDRMYQLLYQNERVERVALQTRALQSMELLADNRLAAMRIGKRDFAETGANVADTENIINFPLQIRTVEVSLLFTEPPEGGATRVSLRSKGQIDVAKFAEQFGGGGHARAAGLRVEAPLDEALNQVTDAMLKTLQRTGIPA